MPKTFFQKGKDGKRQTRDFSVKILSATEAVALLQSIKKMTDDQTEEGVKAIRSFHADLGKISATQRRLILGLYVAMMSGYDNVHISMICNALQIPRHHWYNLLDPENQERTKAILDWVEGLLKDINRSKLAAVNASVADQAAKGSAKHAELFYRVNGLLAPETATQGVAVNFQLFRQMPTEAPPAAPLDLGTMNTPPIPGGAMPQDEVDRLLPVLEELEPIPEEKKPQRNPHGDRYHRDSAFKDEPLV